MVDVAVVRGTLRFDVQGVAQAQSQIEALQNRINAMGQAAAQAGEDASGFAERFAAASPELRRLTREIEILQGRVVAFGPAIAQMRQEAEALAPSLGAAVQELQAAQGELARLRAEFSGSGVDIEAATQAMANIEQTLSSSNIAFDEATAAKLRYRAVVRTLPKELQDNEAAAKDLIEQLRRYVTVEEERIGAAERAVAAHEKLNSAEKRQITTERQLESAVKRTNRELDKVERGPGGGGAGGGGPGRGQGIGVTQTEVRGLITSLRHGRVSSTLFGRALIRLAGAASSLINPFTLAGAAIAAAIAAPVIIGWKALTSELGQAGDAMNRLNIQAQSVGRNLDVAGLSPGQVGAQAAQISNRLESRGLGAGATQAVGEAANVAQFLNAVPGDFEETFRTLGRVVETGSIEPLREFGVEVDRINQMAQDLASQGLTQTEIQAQVVAEAFRQIGESSAEAMAQADREFLTMESIGRDLQALITTIAETEMAEPAREFAQVIRDNWPTIQATIQFTIELLASMTEAFTFAVEGFLVGFRKVTSIAGALEENLGLGVLAAGPIAGPALLALAEIDDVLQDIDNTSQDLEPPDFGDLVVDLERAVPQAERLAQTLERTSRGTGLVGQVQGLANALGAMEEDLNFTTLSASISSFDRLFSEVVQNGTAGLELWRLQARRMNEIGLLPDDALAEAEEMFGLVTKAIAPIEDEARKLRDEMGMEGARANLDNVAGGMTHIQNEAIGATTQANNTRAAIESIPSRKDVQINVVTSYMDAVGGQVIMGAPGGGRVPRPGSPATSTATAEILARDRADRERRQRGASDADRALQGGLREQNEAREAKESADALKDLFAGGQPAGGGGGGDGGGLASIEDIRRLFRNINQLIKIGVNEGTFFSPAGNTIPRGGPNEFLNREGGALVQTVNIRGIWDFADPAAKRQIIKELEEALAGLKKEVG